MESPMKKCLPYLLIAFIVPIGSDSIAETYKWKNAKGKFEYSESPPPTGTPYTVVENKMTEYGYTPSSIYLPPSRPVASNSTVWAETDGAPYQQCIDTKKQAVIAEKRRDVRRAEQLNEWLWKNCRVYSNDLRKIEQQMM